jgi:hypothetical protein
MLERNWLAEQDSTLDYSWIIEGGEMSSKKAGIEGRGER